MFWLIPTGLFILGLVLSAIVMMRDMGLGSAIAGAIVFGCFACAAFGMSIARIIGWLF